MPFAAIDRDAISQRRCQACTLRFSTTRTVPTVSAARDSGSTSASSVSSSSLFSVSCSSSAAGQPVEVRPVLLDQADRLLERLVGQVRLLGVAQALRLLRERVVVGAHRPAGDGVAHAVLEDHRAGEVGRLLEVVGGAVRHPAEDDLLGSPAGEEDLHHVDQLFLRVEEAVLHRQVERVAERLAAGDDRHLVHRQRLAHQVRHQRVPGLVVGEDPLLLLADDAALLETGDDALQRRLELGLADAVEVAAAGEDRRLVADVREVGAGEAGGLARDRLEVDVVGERLAARVDARGSSRGRRGRAARRAAGGRTGPGEGAPGRGPGCGSRRPSRRPGRRWRSRRARRAAG